MSDPILAHTRMFRLLLSGLEDDKDGSVESITRVLNEADGCSDSLIELILTLTDLLVHWIDRSQHREDWLIYIELRLAELLDQLAATPQNDGM